MKRVIITGANGSIGSEVVKHFESAKWNVTKYDPRAASSWPGKIGDALILCHGGDVGSEDMIFEDNVYSVSSILSNLSHIINKNAPVIVLTSRRAKKPLELEWHYSAAKAAAHAYAIALYKTYPNLRITAIAPGWIESKMSARHKVKNAIPVKQLCKLIQCCVECDGMRIPEIFIEPMGEAEF